MVPQNHTLLLAGRLEDTLRVTISDKALVLGRTDAVALSWACFLIWWSNAERLKSTPPGATYFEQGNYL